jgi:tricorn protease-like protein
MQNELNNMNKSGIQLGAFIFLGSMCLNLQAEEVSFKSAIAPILIDNCVACHGPKKAEGGYRVDSYERFLSAGDSEADAITAGSPDESETLQRIITEDECFRMPLEGDPLSAEQITLITRWIKEGAKYDAEDPQAALANIVPAPTYPDSPEIYPRSVPVTAVAFNPAGDQLVAGGYYELTIWNVSDGSLIRRIKNMAQRTFAIRFSNDGKTIIAGGGSPGQIGEARLFDAETGELQQVLGTTSDVVLDVQLNPKGDKLAIAGADGAIQIFNLADGQFVRTITSHSDWVMAIAWNADGTQIASASRDKTAKVFDVETGELSVTYGGHSEPVQGVAFHPNNELVYSSGKDNKIHWWNKSDGKKSGELALGGEVFKLHHSSTFIFAPSADKSVRQLDAASQKEVRKYAGHSDWALSSAFHVDSKRVASGGFNGDIQIWNAEDGKSVVSFVAAPGISKKE